MHNYYIIKHRDQKNEGNACSLRSSWLLNMFKICREESVGCKGFCAPTQFAGAYFTYWLQNALPVQCCSPRTQCCDLAMVKLRLAIWVLAHCISDHPTILFNSYVHIFLLQVKLPWFLIVHVLQQCGQKEPLNVSNLTGSALNEC